MLGKRSKYRIRKRDKGSQLLEDIHDNLNVSIQYNVQGKVFKRISNRIENSLDEDQMDDFSAKPELYPRKKRIHIIGIASSVLLLLAITWLLFWEDINVFIERSNFVGREEPELIQKFNRAGQKSVLNLSDGTRVWLNSESELTFPKEFSKKQRFVRLTGEAFFEVAEDLQKPFIVSSGHVKIKAIGTAFNVMAFQENENVIVSLTEGRIAISSDNLDSTKTIEPGYVASIGKHDQNIDIYQSNVEDLSAWKDGVLIFDNENFKTVIHKLERWYDVDIILEGVSDHSYMFKGRFENEYLSNILKTMQYSKAFEYSVDGRKINIQLN